MADFNKEMYERDYIEIEMKYTSQDGEESFVKKRVPTDWLGLSERVIIDEIYKVFLNTCGFVIYPDDVVEIKHCN